MDSGAGGGDHRLANVVLDDLADLVGDQLRQSASPGPGAQPPGGHLAQPVAVDVIGADVDEERAVRRSYDHVRLQLAVAVDRRARHQHVLLLKVSPLPAGTRCWALLGAVGEEVVDDLVRGGGVLVHQTDAVLHHPRPVASECRLRVACRRGSARVESRGSNSPGAARRAGRTRANGRRAVVAGRCVCMICTCRT